MSKRPASSAPSPNAKKARKPIRVWADGCFDMFHWGHANALRQAKQEGDYLVVGIHSDAEVLKNKGPPVMNEEERYAAVRACKWVDEVVEDAPYVTELSVLNDHNIDFCVHGEDLSIDAFGNDTYQEVKDAGRYRTIKRAEGISSTQLVGRMLLMTRDHLSQSDTDPIQSVGQKELAQSKQDSKPVGIRHFLPTTRQIVLFAEGRSPSADDVVVYIDGAFDLFHVGHVEALERAKALGSYLIVGIHDDETVNGKRGGNHPLLNLHERVLSVLACRYADEVIIGAPWDLTEAHIKSLKINKVARGSNWRDYQDTYSREDLDQAYGAAEALGILTEFKSGRPTLTTDVIIDRILENRKKFMARNAKKAKTEMTLLGVSEADQAKESLKLQGCIAEEEK